jgi:alpha-tubulin suppressor-like RCC1 family protein
VAVTTSGDLSGKTILSISAGGNHTCAIASDSQAYCWGYNSYGQLGDGTTTNRSAPVAVTTSGVLSGKTIKTISAGGSHTCAVASNNQAYCWGRNAYGQLGDGSTNNSSVPVAVTTSGVLSGKAILSISIGYGSHTCAIVDNQDYCWGYNTYGQLGDGLSNILTAPVALESNNLVLNIALYF